MLNIGLLRKVRESELELMRMWRNAPDVRVNMYTRHEIDPMEHRTWWRSVQSREDQRYFMYELDGLATGIVAFSGIDETNGNSSWAFYASPEAVKGSGTKMEYLALNYAFSDLYLHKLHCEVLAFNKPVLKLHQKFGFAIEGVFRDHHRVGEDFVDIYRLGLLAPEWAEKRPEIESKLAKFERG